MAKTKKAKEKKADFQKKKLKVGKAKTAANATSTAFQSRSIPLPSQNIGGSSSTSGPTTKRGQTLETLLVQLNHYSPHTKRDALNGLQELTTAHPALAAEHLGAILRACAKLVVDEDATVRKALIAFIDRMLPSLAQNTLSPFLPLLLFSTTSALTHIFPEVRLDGIKVLDVLLEVCPQAATSGWSASSSSNVQTHGQRILEAYLSILHARAGHGAAATTPAARLVALRSFGNFLRAALFSQAAMGEEEASPTWFFASSFGSSREFDAFLASLTRVYTAPIRQWDAEPVLLERCHLCDSEAGSLSANDLQGAVNELTQSVKGTDNAHSIVSLISLLQPMLTATFLEAAPTAFSPSTASSGPHLETVMCATRIARDLWRACLAEGEKVSKADLKALRTLIDKMGAYFPFAGDDHILMRKDAENRARLEDLDSIFCELASLLVMASEKDAKAATSSATVRAHIFGLLEKQGGVPVSSSAYIALLPSLWTLLRSSESSVDTFAAIVEHFVQAGSGSGVKRVALQFIEHLVELEETTKSISLPKEAVASSHAALPRLLWDLQAKDEATSIRVLSMLHRASLRHTLEGATLDRLCPFFSMQHKERGLVRGPYCRLNARAQALARAIVVYAAYEPLARAYEAVEGA